MRKTGLRLEIVSTLGWVFWFSSAHALTLETKLVSDSRILYLPCLTWCIKLNLKLSLEFGIWNNDGIFEKCKSHASAKINHQTCSLNVLKKCKMKANNHVSSQQFATKITNEKISQTELHRNKLSVKIGEDDKMNYPIILEWDTPARPQPDWVQGPLILVKSFFHYTQA